MDCRLIGHRGEPRCWPENSLSGFRAVLEAGAFYVETDVQITADRVPLLCHDASLQKMTGHDLTVTETKLADILALPAGYPKRFGDRFASERIATLEEFAAMLAQWPTARAFVEIKLASVLAFGIGPVVDLMLNALAGVRAQVVLISFEYPALQHLRSNTGLPIGWVLPEWNDVNRGIADVLGPEYLFVDRKLVPGQTEPLWPGPWRWAVYTANRTSQIESLLAKGFDLVETDDIRRLARDLENRD